MTRANMALRCAALAVGLFILPLPAAAQFRVFVTSTTAQGDLGGAGGLAAGDAICDVRATAGGLGIGPWRAWLSTVATSAGNRITDGAYTLVDGTPVAASLADLVDGTILNPINLDESGVNVGSVSVWTGTTSTGTFAAPNCTNWTVSGAGTSGTVGSTGSTAAAWTDSGSNACNTASRLYCFDTAVVAPAVPSSTWLVYAFVGLMLVGSFTLWMRRRKADSTA